MSLFDFLKSGKKKGKNPPRPRTEPKIASDMRAIEEEFAQGFPRPQGQRKAPKGPKGKKKAANPFRRWLLGLAVRLSLLGAAIGGMGGAYIYMTLPDISKLGEFKKTPSIIVKSEDGTVLGTYGDVYGDYVPYGQLPQSIINAVVATEDRNFFHHHGIDPVGLARATYVNVKAHHLVQGGSTITQQVAKNVFLTPERTLKRKLQEMVLALELERRYSKQEILTIYLNRVYMGAGNYGVDSAARRYFGHSVRNVTLSEAAILVGLLKAPSRYAPTSNPDLSEKRATQVLLNMKDAGYLSDKEVAEAEENFGDEDSSYRDNHSFGAYYFSDFIMGQLQPYLGENKDDLVVTTTLRPDWQRAAEDAVNSIMDAKGKSLKASQAALLSMTPDGAIRAMVGGRNYRASQFNRVTQGLRQPGSSFKLFVYLAGLEAGFTPDSEMVDQPISIGKWHPRDYTGKYKGRMTLREAFAESINSIAVQLSEAVGRRQVVEMAQRLGITSEMNPDPSIALGTNEVTLLDMTRAYAHLASDGRGVLPYAILRIETQDGKKIYERLPSSGNAVLKEQVVRMMDNMLMAVTTSGTGRGAQFGRQVAGKTGTTSDYRDAWFIGFTPQLVTGVWVGNDDTAPMKKVSGGSLPASIWRQYMMAALKDAPVMAVPDMSTPGLFDRILPWFNSSQQPQAAPGAPPGAAGARPQNMQQSLPHPAETGTGAPLAPHANPQATTGQAVGTAAPVLSPADTATQPQPALSTPEEEPMPEYNAPQSFWDKLLGDDDGKKHE